MRADNGYSPGFVTGGFCETIGRTPLLRLRALSEATGCDSGSRYVSRLFNPKWLAEKGLTPKSEGLEFLNRL
jgi:hypothetical protein